MKTNTIFLLLFFVFAISCNVSKDGSGFFNFVPKEGKGPLQTKEFKGNFNEIKVVQSINAEIVKSDEELVKLTAPSDIIDDILIEIQGGKLFVHVRSGANISVKNISVKIFAKDFSALEASSSASIVVKDKFTQDTTSVKVNSSGSVSGYLEANELSVDVSSSAEFSGKVWAVNLKADVSSSGTIDMEGKAKNSFLQASSSGDISAYKLITDNAELDASSSGSISVGVSNSLSASASSSGSIDVLRKGNLNVIQQKENSSGSIDIR